jgi:Cell division protein FtsI/penicillin-binding protein 2
MARDLEERERVRSRNRGIGVIQRHPRSPLWRLRIWQILLCLGALAVIGRLYYLQIYQGPTLRAKAEVQRQQHNMLVHRGAITDRRGLPLAIDTTRYDIFVHVKLLKRSPEESAKILSPIVNVPEEKILKLFNSGYPIVTLARHLERENVDQLQHLNWTGIDIISRPFRQYPEGKLAATLLGYTDMDTKGRAA